MGHGGGRDAPAAEPLVLLPGLLCDEVIWAAQCDVLSLERDVFVADYGDAATLADMADAVLRTAPASFALAGHSMGARVALEVVAAVPERVRRLALLDTGVHPVRAGEAAARHELLSYGEAHGMTALVDRWLPPMVAPHRHGDVALMRPLRDMAIRPGITGYARQIAALLGRRDATPLLDAITCPTLVGVGELDAWSPPAQHQAIAAAIPGAHLVVFVDSGHMAPAETPDAVTAALQQWLAR